MRSAWRAARDRQACWPESLSPRSLFSGGLGGKLLPAAEQGRWDGPSLEVTREMTVLWPSGATGPGPANGGISGSGWPGRGNKSDNSWGVSGVRA